MHKQKSIFERYIDAMEKTGDITLRWLYQKEMMKEQLYSQAALQSLAAAVAPYVIANMSATLDVSDIVKALEELNKSIDELGR